MPILTAALPAIALLIVTPHTVTPAVVSPDAARPPLVAPKPGGRPAPVEAVRPPGSAVRLAAALGHPRWAVREEASRQILARGAGAVDALHAAARGGNPEAAERAVAALGVLFKQSAASDDGRAGEAILAALDGLATDGSPRMRAAAAGAVDSSRDAASRFSLRAVRRLGGVLNISRRPAGLGSEVHVTLDDRWTGGEEGLRHLRRVDGLRNLYLTDGVGLPEGAIADLRAGVYGRLQIESRGRAWLGVTFQSAGAGCEINGVEPGGPADRAGLRAGDVIVRFNGREIRTPSALTEEIRTGVTVGEPVAVLVRRGLEAVEKTVTLDRWRSDPAP